MRVQVAPSPEGKPVMEARQMNKVSRNRRNVKCRSAADWPSTDEIDGVHYGLGPELSDADTRWASEELNQGDGGHTDDIPPDDLIDRMYEESHAASLLERGIRFS